MPRREQVHEDHGQDRDRRGVIGRLVPAAAVVAEAREEDWDAPPLPEEAAQVARAAVRRRREFAAGRACARRALAALGHAPSPLLSGADRAPIWPEGTLGSITHCEGYCAAAAVRAADVPGLRGLGVDAERRVALEDGVVELVCTPAERRRGVDAALVFSAKESVYKAWYPLARRWLDHQDAEIEPEDGGGGGRFAVRLLESAPTTGLPALRFRGRFALTPTHVFTAVTASLRSG